MLRKDAETSWIEDCQKAFDKIKEYMSTPPVLVPPELGRPLLLYLSVLDGAYKIKEYMSTSPVLVPPELGRPLLLYLFVLDGAFGCVLGLHNETGRNEQAIYYLSKKFTPCEARYSLLECTCCALTWTT
ncbi:uncharacterized protein LOC142180805 [Nicotiana tabacum]|uniref:Uncharacterized protein LOC142180805 n=1 Tax=Nicotiana tabacum TaxID=4097 RepID=A0AC58UHL4_TOBAC